MILEFGDTLFRPYFAVILLVELGKAFKIAPLIVHCTNFISLVFMH